MSEIITFGLDLAKNVFQAHGADASGRAVLRRKLRRDQVLAFFGRLAPCVVAMEACGGAHFWGREIGKLGHEVRLIPPAYVKPFVKRQKNDAADAEAICEAALRPTMRFVSVKSEETQGAAMVVRIRELLIRQRTRAINALRGHLGEFGQIVPQGAANAARLIAIVEDPDSGLPADAISASSLAISVSRWASAAAQGWRRMLAIVDPALVESRILAEITSALDGQGVALARFSEIEPEPKDTSVHVALDLARGHAAEVILALGGGTAPAHVAAHSGVDAFVHAFESYLSKQSNLLSDAVNLQAMRMIHDHIRPHVANRAHPVHALQMQCGSALAALSFGQTGTGNVHCMAMAVGGRFAVPHGLANAICLPHVARFNLLADPARFAEVARAMRLDVTGLSDLEAGQRAVEGIERLCRDLDIPSRLRAVGVSEESLPGLARRAFDTNYNRWNPRYTTLGDYETLFRTAY